MGTTSKGIVYPDPSGVPNRAALQTMAETTDAAIVALAALLDGQKIQHGTFTLLVSTTNADWTVSFASAFSGVPRVFCSIIDTAGAASGHRVDRWGAALGDTTGNGSTLGFAFRSTRNSGNFAIRVNWIAIGPA